MSLISIDAPLTHTTTLSISSKMRQVKYFFFTLFILEHGEYPLFLKPKKQPVKQTEQFSQSSSWKRSTSQYQISLIHQHHL